MAQDRLGWPRAQGPRPQPPRSRKGHPKWGAGAGGGDRLQESWCEVVGGTRLEGPWVSGLGETGRAEGAPWACAPGLLSRSNTAISCLIPQFGARVGAGLGARVSFLPRSCTGLLDGQGRTGPRADWLSVLSLPRGPWSPHLLCPFSRRGDRESSQAQGAQPKPVTPKSPHQASMSTKVGAAPLNTPSFLCPPGPVLGPHPVPHSVRPGSPPPAPAWSRGGWWSQAGRQCPEHRTELREPSRSPRGVRVLLHPTAQQTLRPGLPGTGE